MDQNFNIELYKLKKVMSQVKNAIIKKESIPVLFGDHVGQIILAKNNQSFRNQMQNPLA